MSAGVNGEEDGDQTAHDVGITVALEREHWPLRTIRIDRRCEPNLAGAALDLVGVLAIVRIEGIKRAAKLDHVTVPIVPLVEQGKIVDDLVDRHRHRSWQSIGCYHLLYRV